MKYIYLLLIIFSISIASEINLKEFQSGKIKQTSGDVYSYFVPRNNISIRQEKSLNSSKVGKLELTNYLDYDIIDEDEEEPSSSPMAPPLFGFLLLLLFSSSSSSFLSISFSSL